jgi:hypothetical protein
MPKNGKKGKLNHKFIERQKIRTFTLETIYYVFFAKFLTPLVY